MTDGAAMTDGAGAEGEGRRDLSAPVTPDLLRAAMGRFASGVTVVATRWRGMDHAMTATEVASVSLEPPMMMFTVHVDSRFRDALEDQPMWGVSVLTARARAAADWLATPGRPLVGQLSQVRFRRGPFSGAALLDDSLAWLECRTHRILRVGDHDVVFGEVLGALTSATPLAPLIHFRGRMFGDELGWRR